MSGTHNDLFRKSHGRKGFWAIECGTSRQYLFFKFILPSVTYGLIIWVLTAAVLLVSGTASLQGNVFGSPTGAQRPKLSLYYNFVLLKTDKKSAHIKQKSQIKSLGVLIDEHLKYNGMPSSNTLTTNRRKTLEFYSSSDIIRL